MPIAVVNTVFRAATRGDCFHIAQNMRDADRAEIFGTHPDTDTWSLAVDTAAAGAVVAERDGDPIAVIAARPIAQSWLEMYAYATDDWPKVVLAATKYVKRYLIPAYLQAGINRAECRALATNSGTGRWLKACGAVPEAVLEDCGQSRLTFVLWAWRRKDFQVSLALGETPVLGPVPAYVAASGPGLTVSEYVSEAILDAQDRYGT